MNGIELLVDTNVLINLFEGKAGLDEHLQGNRLYVSLITEIELLGWFKITEKERRFFKALLKDCRIVNLLPEIKDKAIELKQSAKLKLPDAIIAATAMSLDIPLLTFDSDFQNINNLNLLLLDN